MVQPGERNFVGDMGVASKLLSNERSLVRAPLTPAVSSPAGSASVGMLATLADVGASDPALASCRTDWTATQDLAIHATGWLTAGPVVVDNRLVRMGSKVIIVASDVYDGRGVEDFDELEAAVDSARAGERSPVRLAARALVTFARLPRTAARDVDTYDPAGWLGQVRERPATPPAAGTMRAWMGMRVVDGDDGAVELERTPYVANSIGTINGGAQAMLVEAAAEAMRPGLVATDLQIHYLSQVKAGPARSRGTVSRDGADHSVLTVELVDAGNDDQLLALATVTLQRPPG